MQISLGQLLDPERRLVRSSTSCLQHHADSVEYPYASKGAPRVLRLVSPRDPRREQRRGGPFGFSADLCFTGHRGHMRRYFGRPEGVLAWGACEGAWKVGFVLLRASGVVLQRPIFLDPFSVGVPCAPRPV